MYGSSFPSGFSVVTSTVYTTTFWVLVAFSRTRPTDPWNVQPGNASTVNRTGWPRWIWPTSASLTEAHTVIRLRSLAIKNRLGVLNDDWTVWPRVTRRSMIVPFTGDLMVQYPRFTSSCWRTALLV